MKQLSLIGFSISIIFLIFGLFLIIIVVPESETAALEIEWIKQARMGDYSVSLAELPGYTEAYATMEKKADYGIILLLGSFLPFLLCLVPAFKRNKLAILGLVFSIGAFFIGAVCGTHLFS